jgi:hypothetical protein
MKTLHLLFLMMIFGSSFTFAEDVVRHTGQLYEGCGAISDSRIWLNDTSDYASVKDGFIYVPGGCGSLPNVAPKYLKVVSGEVVEMSQAEKDTLDANEAAFAQAELTAQSRSGAKDSVDQLSPEGVRLRASLLVVMERFNTVTERIDAVEACIENAGTLTAAKTCLGGLSNLGTVNAAQLKTAIKNKIDAGSAD